MRRDSNTKRNRALIRARGLAAGFLALATVTSIACGSGPNDQLPLQGGGQDPSMEGRVAVVWTLNGQPLTAAACQADGIVSMSVLVVSDLDQEQGEEFDSVTCGLDRYSMEMVPEGPVTVYVEGVNQAEAAYGSTCARYSGQAQTTAGTAFPSQPTPIPLSLAKHCQ